MAKRRLTIVQAPPYGGKSTAKRKLAGTGIVCLDMSDLIREKGEGDPDFKAFADELMARREPIPSDIIFELVEAFMTTGSPENVCLFGFPRWLDQAEWVVNHPVFSRFKDRRLIDVEVSSEELRRRFDLRKAKEDRADDTPENFAKSLHDYRGNRELILGVFIRHRKWKTQFISGDGPTGADIVSRKLCDLFNEDCVPAGSGS